MEKKGRPPENCELRSREPTGLLLYGGEHRDQGKEGGARKRKKNGTEMELAVPGINTILRGIASRREKKAARGLTAKRGGGIRRRGGKVFGLGTGGASASDGNYWG